MGKTSNSLSLLSKFSRMLSILTTQNKPRKEPDVEFEFTPGFLEDANRNVSPEDREEFLKFLEEFQTAIRANPYIGTPLFGGPFNKWFVFTNWVRRTLWSWGFRWTLGDDDD